MKNADVSNVIKIEATANKIFQKRLSASRKGCAFSVKRACEISGLRNPQKGYSNRNYVYTQNERQVSKK